MRSAEEFNAVQRLIAAGVNDCEIARQIGIPRPTVWGWRQRPQVRSRDSQAAPCIAHDFLGLPARAYCYLLGLYLAGVSHDIPERGASGLASTRNTRKSSTGVAWPSTLGFRDNSRLSSNSREDASSFRCTRSTGRVFCHSTVPAGST